jgi:hypothetical protein
LWLPHLPRGWLENMWSARFGSSDLPPQINEGDLMVHVI